MTTKLTPNQIEAMQCLHQYLGQTVEVITSGYDANVSSSFKPVCKASSSALRGLQSRGYIRIENAYWKGATVTVLKQMEI